MKVVLDSNVVIAAFATRGLSNALFELCLDRHTIITSAFILDEVHKAFLQKLRMPLPLINKIEKYIKESCLILPFTKMDINICRDRDDDNILALAASAKADFIITGDQDLLVLKKHQSIRIVSPREFWEVERQR